MHLRRGRTGLLIDLELDRSSDEALSNQIYRQLRDLIRSGGAPGGASIPSTRTLAPQLGVSRSTVALAFDQLRAEGYVATSRGSATRVAAQLPDGLPPPPSPRLETVLPPDRAPRLSRRGAEIASLASPLAWLGQTPRAFRLGVPALDQFPVALWERVVGRELRRTPASRLSYGDPRGIRPLREAIARYLRSARRIECDPDDIIVTCGSQQAIALAASLVVDPGDRVWVEDPGYLPARGAFIAAGGTLIDLPVDQDGMRVDLGLQRAPDARAAFVVPGRQVPLGSVLSEPRRRALLKWAADHRAWIIEDDYAADLHYSSRPTGSLRAATRGSPVLYVGSFSKTIFPALRIGYLVAPSHLAESFARARVFSDIHPPYHEQAVLAAFMQGGHFERHVRRVRAAYLERQTLLRSLLERELAGVARVETTDGALHLVLWLPRDWTEELIVREGARRGLDLVPLSSFCSSARLGPGLVLGYSGLREDEIRKAAGELAGLILERAGRAVA